MYICCIGVSFMELFLYNIISRLMPTREEYHKIKWNKTFGKDDCPFCDIPANEGHIIWKGKYWYIIHNIYPYSGEENHLMLVPFRHVVFSHQLSSDETQELSQGYNKIKEFYGEELYFSFTRETMANRSIEHLHIHFVPGKLQGKYIRNMLMHQGFPVVQHLD